MSAAQVHEDRTEIEPADLGIDQTAFDAIVENIAIAVAHFDDSAAKPNVAQQEADRELARWWITIFFAAGYVPTPRAQVPA